MRIAITSAGAAEAAGHSAEGRPACATDTDLYLHPLLDDGLDPATAPDEVRPELTALITRARASCAACPLLPECLYAAVVQRDVSGFVGCTTPGEREQIRARLGARPEREDLDAAAGVRGERRPVDHEAVLAMRTAYPEDSLETLANRLDCSLSTIKRHLRRARREQAGNAAADASDDDRPRPRTKGVPTVDDVLDVFDDLVEAG